MKRPVLFDSASFDLVVLAGSTGAIPVLKQALAELPPMFPAALAIVQHMAPLYPSMLAEYLGQRAWLPIAFAKNGDRPRGGMAVVAPPDRHLVITPERRFALSQAAKVNYTRPSADPLFHSAAAAFGSRVLAVVLSGMGCDAADGVRAVKARGGFVIIQDPHGAEAAGMPAAAIATGTADLVLPTEAIGKALVSLVMTRTARLLFTRQGPDGNTSEAA
jgi:two-component system chemotaxis response regulator CheB